jgi:hypothetical protein
MGTLTLLFLLFKCPYLKYNHTSFIWLRWKIHSYINIIGKAENVVKRGAEFDLKLEQYLTLLGGSGTFPVNAIIPNSPRYKVKDNKKSTKPVQMPLRE